MNTPVSCTKKETRSREPGGDGGGERNEASAARSVGGRARRAGARGGGGLARAGLAGTEGAPRGRARAGAGGEHPTEPDGTQSGADEGSPASSR